MISSRWKEGDRVNRFTVTLVLGLRDVRKNKRTWMYRLQCDCGRSEDLSQERLVGGKSQRIDCKFCMQKRTRAKPGSTWIEVKDLPYGVPDFARIPAPSTAKRPGGL